MRARFWEHWDFEAALPFVLIALLLWPTGLVELFYDIHGIAGLVGVLPFALGIMVLSLPMFLTRAFDRPRGDRLAYFVVNEVCLFVLVLPLLLVQCLGPRREFSPDLESQRRSTRGIPAVGDGADPRAPLGQPTGG